MVSAWILRKYEKSFTIRDKTSKFSYRHAQHSFSTQSKQKSGFFYFTFYSTEKKERFIFALWVTCIKREKTKSFCRANSYCLRRVNFRKGAQVQMGIIKIFYFKIFCDKLDVLPIRDWIAYHDQNYSDKERFCHL